MTHDAQLFATCLAEEFFPDVSTAAAHVLERLGVHVRPMRGAFCCGQVAFNEGLRPQAIELARLFLSSAGSEGAIVVPSGSCAATLKVFYRELLANELMLAERAYTIAPRIFEFSQFIVDRLNVTDVGARFERAVAYHPSCHLLRELRVKDAPMRLLSAVRGIRLCELKDREECCGFGGLFSVKFADISAAILDDKLKRIAESGDSSAHGKRLRVFDAYGRRGASKADGGGDAPSGPDSRFAIATATSRRPGWGKATAAQPARQR